MKKIVLAIISFLMLTGCGSKNADAASYQQISQKAAKDMMDNQTVIVLDVRENYEYDTRHIHQSEVKIYPLWEI